MNIGHWMDGYMGVDTVWWLVLGAVLCLAYLWHAIKPKLKQGHICPKCKGVNDLPGKCPACFMTGRMDG